MNNLKLWEQVCTTDPAKTSQIGFGESKGKTSVNPQYRIKMATEHLGPIGIGWGYEIKEERFDNGAAVFDADGNHSDFELVHTIRLELWYMLDGERGTVQQYGHTPYKYLKADGSKWITDKEYAKKTLTDALGKCLSMLGFNSDIYEGEYDSAAYVSAIADEFEIKNATDQEAKRIEKEQEYRDRLEKNIELIGTSQSKHEVEGIYKTFLVAAKRKNDKEGIERITKATKERVDYLNEQERKK